MRGNPLRRTFLTFVKPSVTTGIVSGILYTSFSRPFLGKFQMSGTVGLKAYGQVYPVLAVNSNPLGTVYETVFQLFSTMFGNQLKSLPKTV